MDTLVVDCRYALRALKTRRSFAIVAVLTMALGIGAATAMFAVVDNVLLRPLKYRESDRLVSVWGVVGALKTDTVIGGIWNRFTVAFEDYETWRQQQTVFEETAILSLHKARFVGPDETRTVPSGDASANFFAMLGTPLFRGRSFADREADAIVVSYDFWSTALGGGDDVIGRRIRLDQSVKTIVGVLPPRFEFAGYGADTAPNPQIWQAVRVANPTVPDYEIIGRVRPGIPLADAERETDRIFSGLRFTFLNDLPALDKQHGARLEPRKEVETGTARMPLLILLMASMLLLLIACGNVANLVLAEARGREHEMAMRAALGASAMRILRQLILENVLLALTGGMLGAAIAWLGVRSLLWLRPPGLPRIDEIVFDFRVFALMTIASAVTGIFFGLAPALALMRPNLVETLKSRGQHRGSGSGGYQSAVVIAEVALCFVLLVGAGLLVRTLLHLSAVDPGFSADNLIAVQIALPRRNYEDTELPKLYDQVMSEMRSLPGVTAVTAASAGPFEDFRSVTALTIEGKPAVIETRTVWPDYFSVIGRLIEGRSFTRQEIDTKAPVVVVSRSMARQFWPNESAVNKRIEFPGRTARIVGVSDDVSLLGVTVAALPMYYSPMSDGTDFSVLIRTSQMPDGIAPALRARIRSINEAIAVNRIDQMKTLIRSSFAEERYRTLLIGVFAVSAVFLALVGLYGVMSRYVVYRNRELGIRLALGAAPRSVLALILRRGLILCGAGIALGAAGAVGGGRVLSNYLFGLSPLDAVTYLGVAILLTGVSVFATYGPARRASRIDPAVCLRAE